MPFIGKQPQAGAYSKLDAITTSATATYNLTLDSGAYYPQSANHLLVSLNGVIQAPQDSFTVSGSQIIFDSALTSADVIDFIIALGDTLDIGVPSAGSVNTSQLANDAVTTAKIAAGQVTSAKLDTNIAVAGTLDVTGLSTLTDIAGTQISVINNQAAHTNIDVFNNDGSASAKGQIRVGYDASNCLEIFRVGNSANILLNATQNGAIIFQGAGSERIRLTGDGLTFNGDTAAANALDDYEEGTWTPQIWKGSTQVTSPTSVFGQYRKIGDVIFYSFYFFKSSGSNTDTSYWQLKGMPFAMESAATSGYTCLTAGYTGINSVNYFDQAGSHRWQNNGSSNFDLYGPQQTTQWTSGHIEFAGYGFVYAA